MRVCGGALRRREKNYTCANNAYVHVVVANVEVVRGLRSEDPWVCMRHNIKKNL